MKRSPATLADRTFDVLVIGGGISGAWVLWEATLRGLNAALIERDDFGAGASATGLSVLPEGLRAFPHGHVQGLHAAIAEHRTLRTIAPHLVHPRRTVLPAYGYGRRGLPRLAAAITAADVVGYRRNRGTGPSHRLPGSELLFRNAARGGLTAPSPMGLTGAVGWYDAHVADPARLVLALIAAAVGRGAEAANHLTVTGLPVTGGRVTGAAVVDEQSGDTFTMRAHAVVNCTGVSAPDVAALAGRSVAPMARQAWMLDLITAPFGAVDHGFGFYLSQTPSQGMPTPVYVTPHAGYHRIGTLCVSALPYAGTHMAPDAPGAEAVVEQVWREVRDALPGAGLSSGDLWAVQQAMLPVSHSQSPPQRPPAGRGRAGMDGEVIDHRRDGLAGLTTVLRGPFYQTGRIAERAVVQILGALQHTGHPTGARRRTPIAGGDVADWWSFVADLSARSGGRMDPSALRALAACYGTATEQVLALSEDANTPPSPDLSADQVLTARARYAVRHEMACSLRDVIRRCMDPVQWHRLPQEQSDLLARVVAVEMDWDSDRLRRERAAADAQRQVGGGVPLATPVGADEDGDDDGSTGSSTPPSHRQVA